MLCSHLGLANGESQVSPLTLKEWNALARKIHDSEIKTPAALIGLSIQDLIRGLELSPAEAERLVHLLSRGGGLALELDHLAASGIWCVTRADAGYPLRLRNTLKHQASRGAVRRRHPGYSRAANDRGCWLCGIWMTRESGLPNDWAPYVRNTRSLSYAGRRAAQTGSPCMGLCLPVAARSACWPTA